MGEAVEHTIEILHTGFVTHDVRRFVTTRPTEGSARGYDVTETLVALGADEDRIIVEE